MNEKELYEKDESGQLGPRLSDKIDYLNKHINHALDAINQLDDEHLVFSARHNLNLALGASDDLRNHLLPEGVERIKPHGISQETLEPLY